MSNLLSEKQDRLLQFCLHIQINYHFLSNCSLLIQPLLFSFLKKATLQWYRNGSFKDIFQYDLLSSGIVLSFSIA